MAQPVTAILGMGHEVGDALARRFLERGHDIVVADPSANRLERARETISDKAMFHHGELHTKLGLRNCFASAAESFGRIDNAVIIPAIAEADNLQDFDSDRFDKAVIKSVRGAALTLRVFSERIDGQEDLPGSGLDRVRQNGTVTFILSHAAASTMPGRFTESVTQAAVRGAMQAGAVELAEHGIRVNAIVAIRPRAEKTDPWTTKRTPLGRAALGDEIADAAYFLASPEAAIITGETLMLDGGRARLSGILD
jgi:NAD(P)-dependent dehydrogenase (short-subunit alcohol dehydrogenase family)